MYVHTALVVFVLSSHSLPIASEENGESGINVANWRNICIINVIKSERQT